MGQGRDEILTEILSFSVALLAASVFVPLARRFALRAGVLDIPNERSSHSVPTPRTGGLGILAGVLAGLAVVGVVTGSMPSTGEWWLLAFLGAGSLIGFADDWKRLPTAVRFPGYLVVSTGICLAYARVEILDLPGIPTLALGSGGGVIFSVLFVAWYTNLFNFMDGIDGIAGGAAAICLGALGVVFEGHGDAVLAGLAFASAGASVGFLFYNYPPASVFMGDGGSVFLGLAAGALSLAAVAQGALSLSAAVLLMLPFVFDATFTLIRRIVQRERFWAAHRSHVYQQMCDLGLSHRAVTTIFTVAAVIFASLGMVFDRLPPAARITSWWLSLVVLLLLSIFVVVRRKKIKSA